MNYPKILDGREALTFLKVDDRNNIFIKVGTYEFTIVDVWSEYFDYERVGTWVPLYDFYSNGYIESIDWGVGVQCKFEVLNDSHVEFYEIKNSDNYCTIIASYEDNDKGQMVVTGNFFEEKKAISDGENLQKNLLAVNDISKGEQLLDDLDDSIRQQVEINFDNVLEYSEARKALMDYITLLENK